MILDSRGRTFIRSREGFRSEPYPDLKGIPTIGYGTTVYSNGVKVSLKDKPISREEAELQFLWDVSKFEDLVNKALTVTVTQNQFNALVSLAYNIGPSFNTSTLLKRINSGLKDDHAAIPEAFLMWNKISQIVKGVKVYTESPGLTSRRKKEIDLYFS